MPLDFNTVSGDRCLHTIRTLDAMGIRFAGTEKERESADWIRDQFSALQLESIEVQEFPCMTFSYTNCTLQGLYTDKWKTLQAEVAAHSASTPERGIQGNLVRIEKIPASASACRDMAHGQIVLLYSSEFCQFQNFRRVMAAKPAAVLLMDDRFPNSWTVAIGFPRYWVDFISCPILNISYTTAWDLVTRQVTEVRLEVTTSVSEAPSQNVIGEIRGSKNPDEVIIVSGHHDSVINNPGADDNCSGVAAVLELARLFVDFRPDRTVRFISYGAEEQLSEGAIYYAVNAADRDGIQFVLNVDAVGAHMGSTSVYYTGTRELADTLQAVNRQTGFPAHLQLELSPFSDHFPLSLAGIPVAWYYRTTYVAARHFHHSALETPEVISARVMEETVRHQAVLLNEVANGDLPFPRAIPKSQMKRLRALGRDWCGFPELPERLAR